MPGWSNRIWGHRWCFTPSDVRTTWEIYRIWGEHGDTGHTVYSMKKGNQELNRGYWWRKMKRCFALNSNGEPVLRWRNVTKGTEEQAWSYLTSPLHCHLYLSSPFSSFFSFNFACFFAPLFFFFYESVHSKLLIGFL